MENKIPNLKVVFFGTPFFVDPVLEILEKNFDLIKTFRDPKEFSEQTIEDLKNTKPDLFVVASFGKILPKELLSVPKFGAINIHPSLLPRYRGPTPVQTAILEGERNIGLSFILMDEKVDHGPIIYQEEIVALGNKNSEEALVEVFKIAAEKLAQIISQYIATRRNESQDEGGATYTTLFKKDDGFVDISNPPSSSTLDQMIRAFYPWPGVWTKFKISNKEQIIKFLPGEMIQVEGKKPMNYKDFMNGYPEGKELLKKLSLS